MKVLGIIPARGGSKGVPNKNIVPLDGEPLIGYTIQAAMESELLNHYLVATDDLAIKSVAKSYGCKVYERSQENAMDDSPVELVVKEVLDELSEVYDIILLLQPTAPIKKGTDIDNVIKMFLADKFLNNVVSVVELDDIHPARMYSLNAKQELFSLNMDSETKRRQDLKPVYIRNGCIYAITTKAFKEQGKMILNEKKAYVMPYNEWVNIDVPRDVIIAEQIVKLWKKGRL